MTNERIIELAKRAGFQTRGDIIRTMHSSGAWVGINDELQRFYELARNKALDEAIGSCKDYAAIPKVDSGVPLAIAHKIELLKS